MAPKDRVRVDCEKMRADAKVWQDSALDIGAAAATARGLVLTQADFSFAGGEVYSAYQDLQTWLAGLLQDAAKNLSNMAGALAQTADDFENQDAASSGHINKAYPDN